MYETGFQVFNFSHLIDIADVKRRVGRRDRLMGKIPPLDVLAIGNPETVFQASRECVLKAKDGGGTYFQLEEVYLQQYL